MKSEVAIKFNEKALESVLRQKIQSGQILHFLEIETVRANLRDAALVFGVKEENLEALKTDYANEGLTIKALEKIAPNSGFYHCTDRPQPGADYRYKCVVARSDSVAEEFFFANKAGDDALMGRLLGYPACCCAFFHKIWREGCFDPIWETASGGGRSSGAPRQSIVSVHGHPLESIIALPHDESASLSSAVLRYIGIRILSHFPCSWNCEESKEIAKKRVAAAIAAKKRGVEDALQLLRLTYEWTCQDGIAKISTPFFSFETRSMPYRVKHTVRQSGREIL